ncbi:class I SAM-dependent methyltransferase [Candidatus Pelagibacter bacterium nBUS_25]|uniref:class I SAM-dependent methyltransferase n=1 Tax=Candidatus Pelagibacter bacterium nBUS_25 TaxID=3374187 RepID=UPI003EBF25FE
MSNNRKIFYERMINDIILDKKSTILVVGATKYDSDIFQKNGFSNVTISNLDSSTDYSPHKHSLQDLRKINYQNQSFEYVVANACIHHTSKPHEAILEMYRVSKNGIIVIEGNDSNLIKITNFLNLSQEYELSAVINDDYSHDKGGVDNSFIPNFVYRWTKREIYKLISSYEPQYTHKINFFYNSDFGGYKNVKKTSIIKPILYILEILAKLYFIIFSSEKNLFCFFINKKEKKLKEWLKIDSKNKIQLNKEYLNKKIKK